MLASTNSATLIGIGAVPVTVETNDGERVIHDWFSLVCLILQSGNQLTVCNRGLPVLAFLCPYSYHDKPCSRRPAKRRHFI